MAGEISRVNINGDIYNIRDDTSFHPNMLHNWYLTDPIIQSGQTEYHNYTGWVVDRWRVGRANVTLTDDGVSVAYAKGMAGHAYTFFQSEVENGANLVGQVVTMSALIDNELYMVTGLCPAKGDESLRYNLPFEGDTISYIALNFASSVDNPVATFVWNSTEGHTIKAVKLELGPIQTLAHKEGDTWVLNDPPPDKALELVKCQRHQYVLGTSMLSGHISAGGNNFYAVLPLPVPLRVKPTVVVDNVTVVVRTVGGYSTATPTAVAPSAITVDTYSGASQLTLHFSFSETIATNNTPGTISISSGKIILDSNL